MSRRPKSPGKSLRATNSTGRISEKTFTVPRIEAPPARTVRKTGDVEQEVRAALEEARQNVKPLAKSELEGEVVTAELLNVRLGA